MNKEQAARANSRFQSPRRLPLAIWVLGFGSLLMDTSSELVHRLSPVLLVNMLGASVVAVGIIEGVAEGTAAVTKVFAGALSDEIMSGKQSGNIFYSFAEEIRALALLQAAVPDTVGTLLEGNATEENIRQAAIRLYEAYKPVHDAFEAFANDILVKIVQSLHPQTEKFTPSRVTGFSEMSPVLFVKEPTPEEAREMAARASS